MLEIALYKVGAVEPIEITFDYDDLRIFNFINISFNFKFYYP